MNRTPEDYLDLPYTIRITHDRSDDGCEGFVAEVEELPGVISQGETLEDAAVPSRMRCWGGSASRSGTGWRFRSRGTRRRTAVASCFASREACTPSLRDRRSRRVSARRCDRLQARSRRVAAATGHRLRLKQSFPIAGFPRQARIVLRALKEYGMILADNGSDWYLSSAPHPKWSNDQLHTLHRVAASAFEVVDGTVLRR